MKWQWKLGTFAGIDVYIHATFLILIAWVGYSHWLKNENWGEVFSGILFILALFACVILHEYGHGLTARKYESKPVTLQFIPSAVWLAWSECQRSRLKNCGSL